MKVTRQARILDNKPYTMRWVTVTPIGERKAFATKREAVAYLNRLGYRA